MRRSPGSPPPRCQAHQGRFLFGYVEEEPVVVMQGRVHYYEGYPMEDVVLPLRVMHALGARRLVLTNAAGGIDPAFQPGGPDGPHRPHRKLCALPPAGAQRGGPLAPRFPDMSEVYSPRLREKLRAAGEKLGVPLREGVYPANHRAPVRDPRGDPPVPGPGGQRRGHEHRLRGRRRPAPGNGGLRRQLHYKPGRRHGGQAPVPRGGPGDRRPGGPAVPKPGVGAALHHRRVKSPPRSCEPGSRLARGLLWRRAGPLFEVPDAPRQEIDHQKEQVQYKAQPKPLEQKPSGAREGAFPSHHRARAEKNHQFHPAAGAAKALLLRSAPRAGALEAGAAGAEGSSLGLGPAGPWAGVQQGVYGYAQGRPSGAAGWRSPAGTRPAPSGDTACREIPRRWASCSWGQPPLFPQGLYLLASRHRTASFFPFSIANPRLCATAFSGKPRNRGLLFTVGRRSLGPGGSGRRPPVRRR